MLCELKIKSRRSRDQASYPHTPWLGVWKGFATEIGDIGLTGPGLAFSQENKVEFLCKKLNYLYTLSYFSIFHHFFFKLISNLIYKKQELQVVGKCFTPLKNNIERKNACMNDNYGGQYELCFRKPSYTLEPIPYSTMVKVNHFTRLFRGTFDLVKSK